MFLLRWEALTLTVSPSNTNLWYGYGQNNFKPRYHGRKAALTDNFVQPRLCGGLFKVLGNISYKGTI